MINCKRCLALTIALAVLVVFSGPIWAEEGGTININTASLEELVKLKRIGPKFAQRIIDYRSENPFQTPEDITKVRGIGPKTLEENRDLIVVE